MWADFLAPRRKCNVEPAHRVLGVLSPLSGASSDEELEAAATIATRFAASACGKAFAADIKGGTSTLEDYRGSTSAEGFFWRRLVAGLKISARQVIGNARTRALVSAVMWVPRRGVAQAEGAGDVPSAGSDRRRRALARSKGPLQGLGERCCEEAGAGGAGGVGGRRVRVYLPIFVFGDGDPEVLPGFAEETTSACPGCINGVTTADYLDAAHIASASCGVRTTLMTNAVRAILATIPRKEHFFVAGSDDVSNITSFVPSELSDLLQVTPRLGHDLSDDFVNVAQAEGKLFKVSSRMNVMPDEHDFPISTSEDLANLFVEGYNTALCEALDGGRLYSRREMNGLGDLPGRNIGNDEDYLTMDVRILLYRLIDNIAAINSPDSYLAFKDPLPGSEEFNWTAQANFRTQLELAGLDDPDDGLNVGIRPYLFLVHDAARVYAAGIVSLSYDDETAVSNDDSLQAFALDLCSEDAGNIQGLCWGGGTAYGRGQGYPDEPPIASRQGLSELLGDAVSGIFLGHIIAHSRALVGNLFVPFSPLRVRPKFVPTPDSVCTAQDVVDTFGDHFDWVQQVLFLSKALAPAGGHDPLADEKNAPFDAFIDTLEGPLAAADAESGLGV
eukprot:g10144.t1